MNMNYATNRLHILQLTNKKLHFTIIFKGDGKGKNKIKEFFYFLLVYIYTKCYLYRYPSVYIYTHTHAWIFIFYWMSTKANGCQMKLLGFPTCCGICACQRYF